jgi:predicted ATPase
MQAIAYYNNSINVSSSGLDTDYYEAVQKLSKKMKIIYTVKTRKGFFFSGEEFITYINSLKKMKVELLQDIEEIKKEFMGKDDYSLKLALGPLRKSLYQLDNKYEGELRQKSHGEGFLEFFKARMHQQGIYLLDEPETPLSAVNQYQLVVLITDLVKAGSQVIIATHSPILMALKDAKIYNFSENCIEETKYEDIESVQFMKHFLNDKNNFIERL